MAQIDTLRPVSTIQGTGWSAEPSGTLHGVTADDNDTTYAEWSGDGSPLILSVGPHAPPAGHRRHAARLRVRGESGSAWWAVRRSDGVLVAGAAADFAAANTVIGAWGTGLPPNGTTTFGTYVNGEVVNTRILELYLDIDSRAAPQFTPQLLDGSGAPATTITDTNSPTVAPLDVDLDGLPPRQYRYWIDDGSNIVWDTGIVSGPAVNREVDALDNGSYTLHMVIWSTLGANTEYASEEKTLAFDINVVPVTPPDNVTSDAIPDTPFFQIEVQIPSDLSDYDEPPMLQIQRVDCHGTRTVAVIGPVEAGTSVSYVDWSAPRSLPADCLDDATECPFTYRARFVGKVDGARVTSLWSDDVGIVARGIIIAWPGNEADIPRGWTRVNDLNSRFVKSVPALTNPGARGGSSTHSHATPGHTHSLNHSHGGGTTGSSSGFRTNANTNPAGNFWSSTGHTHTIPTTGTSTISSGNAAPQSDAVSNNPDFLDVIWIQSNGSPLGLPNNAIGLFQDVAPTGWDTYDDATGRFLRGASTGSDGGTTVDSALRNHTHNVASHTHGGNAHSHTSGNTSAFSADLPGFAGGQSAGFATSHTHPVTISITNTGSLHSASGGTSGSASPDEPPFINLRVRQNTSGDDDLPVGVIALWRGSIAAIPDGWVLCDGNNGTPNMLGLYVKGAVTDIEGTGGSLSGHTHTGATHSHTISSHTHTALFGEASHTPFDMDLSAATTVARENHLHTAASIQSATPTVGESSTGTLASTTTEPLYEEVAFIQFKGFDNGPEQETITHVLHWAEGEHLIRAITPDGPMFRSICGTVEWDVQRPFTANVGVGGTSQVHSGAPGGRDYRLRSAVGSESDLEALEAISGRPLILVSPADAPEQWCVPVGLPYQVIKIGRMRSFELPTIGTGPEPEEVV